MNRIGMDELEKVIDQELSDYIKETTSAMREVVEEVTDSAVDTLKISSPRKTGKYARGWKSKSTSDSPTGLTKTIHNRTPGLTHLLDKDCEDFMTLKDFYNILIKSKLPVAYHHFEEGRSPAPPFIVYLVKDSENAGADNWSYHKTLNLQVELYTLKKDLEIETKMDDLFDSHSIFFDKVETYISTEKLYQITYYISLNGG